MISINSLHRSLKGTVFLFSLTLSSFCFSQGNELLMRDSFQLKVAVDKNNFYQDNIKSSPYVLPENTIQIYPGETIFVEVELQNKDIKSMKVVKDNLNPDKTIKLTFSQTTEKKVHTGMMLSVQNPFKYKLQYKAIMYLMKNKKWIPTSVYPVGPNMSGFETWTDIILTLALTGWSFE